MDVLHTFIDDTTHPLPALGRMHHDLTQNPPPRSAHGVLLHTCQRVEWYAVGDLAAPVPALRERPIFLGRQRALVRLAQIAAGTRSLVLGEQFVFRQVRAAAEQLPSNHPLFRLLVDALDLAERAREEFRLQAHVDYSDLPRFLLDHRDRGQARRLLIIGGGMLARAVAAAPPGTYEQIVMMTRGPRKLRRLVDGADNITVVRAASLRKALGGRPYDTVIATTNLGPDYRAWVSAAAWSPHCCGVVDLCGEPALDRRPARYLHLYDPDVLETLAEANRDVAERAVLARRWIAQHAEVLV
ncbi:hypothetical protein LO772_12565 [Yinghuangia sp. ASG 101]|uniref:hypothetical protein n=1 Tax=Yinghuangia sp. ASG 101 TaxID=2896848 RepID=UPI001E3D2828|nr:hypothetical protein [Yinghuangia sp. ASG 101]UGQ14341.1 hypothetical protein LO772_12565 [Yinghuangia sp. ASG 101]